MINLKVNKRKFVTEETLILDETAMGLPKLHKYLVERLIAEHSMVITAVPPDGKGRTAWVPLCTVSEHRFCFTMYFLGELFIITGDIYCDMLEAHKVLQASWRSAAPVSLVEL